MSLIEGAATLLLGRRIEPPPHLRPGDVPAGVILREGRLVPRIGGVLARMRSPAAAVTLGRTIVIHPGVPLTRSLLIHELTHVRQWREDLLFPLRYSVATLRHGYRDNPYEVEARIAAASDHPPTDRTT
jgi:hypothetical protein